MGNCENCSGGCGGCAGSIELTEGEVSVLQSLGQIPFLPVARKTDDMVPVYLEECLYSVEQYSLILQHLEKKSLISLDYTQPLKGFSMDAYKRYPVHGVMSLTRRGQQVLELLELQGFC